MAGEVKAWWDRVFARRKPSERLQPTEGAKLVVSEQQDQKPTGGGDLLSQALAGLGNGSFSDGAWYRKSSWVYACIKMIATNTSSVGWYVKERQANGQYKRLDGHEAERLLAYPNEVMAGQDLMETSSGNLLERGNSLWFKLKTIKGVEELWPIDPSKIKPVLSMSTGISHYEYGRKRKRYEVNEIIHFKLMDPDNFFWGMSPLEPAGLLAQVEVEMLKWWRTSMMNRCIKDGIVTFKHPMAIEQVDHINKMWRDQMMGPENARGPMVTGSDADFKPWTMTPVELDFVKSRQMTKEELCVVFGIPSVLMIPDNSSYNNIKTAQMIFWVNAVIPFLQNMCATLNTSLIRDYLQPGQRPGDLVFDFDLSGVPALLEIFADKVDIGLKLFQMGFPLNEISKRLDLGLPEVDGGDIGYVTANVLPIGDAAAISALEAGQQDPDPGRSLPEGGDRNQGSSRSNGSRSANGDPEKAPAASRNGSASKGTSLTPY